MYVVFTLTLPWYATFGFMFGVTLIFVETMILKLCRPDELHVVRFRKLQYAYIIFPSPFINISTCFIFKPFCCFLFLHI